MYYIVKVTATSARNNFKKSKLVNIEADHDFDIPNLVWRKIKDENLFDELDVSGFIVDMEIIAEVD